ncbi:MAG: hypothetical protein ABIT58_08670, partial [Ferruginibacter sp.]
MKRIIKFRKIFFLLSFLIIWDHAYKKAMPDAVESIGEATADIKEFAIAAQNIVKENTVAIFRFFKTFSDSAAAGIKQPPKANGEKIATADQASKTSLDTDSGKATRKSKNIHEILHQENMEFENYINTSDANAPLKGYHFNRRSVMI